jgi:hypothetical protein
MIRTQHYTKKKWVNDSNQHATYAFQYVLLIKSLNIILKSIYIFNDAGGWFK